MKRPSKDIKYLTFKPYDLIDIATGHVVYLGEIMDEDIEPALRSRSYEGYPIDGIVYKSLLTDKIQYDSDGYRSQCWAYKPYAMDTGELTFIEGIEWEISRHGKLTPVAILNSVFVDGVWISRVTLNSASYVLKHNLHTGCIVKIVRSGGVIPKVIHVISDIDNKEKLPQTCPHCNAKVSLIGAHLYCNNTMCYARNIEYMLYALKDVLGVRDIGAPTVRSKFLNFVNNQFPKGSFDDIMQKFIMYVSGITQITLAQFIQLCNLEAVGKTISNKIEQICSYQEFLDAIHNRTLHRLGLKSAVCNTMYDNIVHIWACGESWADFIVKSSNTSLKKIVVLTGVFSIGRENLIERFAEQGILVKSSVTKDVNYVLVGKEPGKTKIAKANTYHIPVLDLSDPIVFDTWLQKQGLDLQKIYKAEQPTVDFLDI